MRISDWSSDVCSSDLQRCGGSYPGKADEQPSGEHIMIGAAEREDGVQHQRQVGQMNEPEVAVDVVIRQQKCCGDMDILVILNGVGQHATEEPDGQEGDRADGGGSQGGGGMKRPPAPNGSHRPERKSGGEGKRG